MRRSQYTTTLNAYLSKTYFDFSSTLSNTSKTGIYIPATAINAYVSMW